MNNELQIRLTADITALLSAFKKVEGTIKSFEQNVNKETEKSNSGFTRQKGLIEELNERAKRLRTSLSQATSKTEIAVYNKQLEQTSKELATLNALGRSVTANLGSTASGFGQVARQGANANGVAIEFNRVIQDAPFGIIGIGNNLQQLAGNFQQVAKSAGGTGAAIKASLASIISPVNLGLLAVSALTAGFTAYQMGAFDSLFANEKLAKSFEELASETQSATANAAVETTKLNILRQTIEDETISRDRRLEAVNRLQDAYPAIFGNADKEKILNGQLISSYELLTKAIVQRAEASIAEQELPALVRQKELVDAELSAKNALLQTELDLLDARNKLTPISQTFSGSDFEQAQRRIKDLKEEVFGLENTANGLQINIDGFTESIVSYAEQFENLLDPVNIQLDNSVPKIKRVKDEVEELTRLLEIARLERRGSFFEGVEAPLARRESGQQITQGVLIPDLPVDEFEEQGLKIQEVNRAISDSFSALGVAIASNLDIQNDAVKGFVSTVLSNAPKIIQAVFATAQANKVAAASNIATAKKGALANGIFMATETGKSLGPIGLALLPVLIGGALALISSAFNGGSGGGSSIPSAAGSSSGAPPQIFTNSQIPRPPGSSAPTPTGNIDFGNAQGRLEARIDGNDIVFVYDRTKERQQGGG